MKFLFTISLIVLSLDAVRADSNASIRGTDVKTSDSNDKEKCPVFKHNPKNGNTKLGKKMINATMPCGYYQSQGCTYEVIPANIVHPGEGVGDLDFKPYIVQFDIGVHPNIKEKVLNDHKKLDKDDQRECIGCKSPGETCLEIIVEGNSGATEGGCAGKCGAGCVVGAGWAKDCMKHDVCVTYKALIQTDLDFTQPGGFCYDPDCGDEAATTIHNCYINRKWRQDKPITCEEDNFSDEEAYGHWSYISYYDFGPCHNFINWKNGQGLPDKDKIRNPYDFLAHLESQGVDISHAD